LRYAASHKTTPFYIGIFGWRPSKRARKRSVALLRAKMHSL